MRTEMAVLCASMQLAGTVGALLLLAALAAAQLSKPCVVLINDLYYYDYYYYCLLLRFCSNPTVVYFIHLDATAMKSVATVHMRIKQMCR